MKFFLALLSFGLLAEVCWGASLQRFKRDVANGKDSYQLMKAFVTELKPILEAVHKELPDSESYSKYKQAFGEILDMYDVKGVVCYKKIVNIVTEFGTTMEKFSEGETTAELEKVVELCAEHKLEELVDSYDMDNAADPKFDELTEIC